jgi:ABC-type antimicrobial peptide transport system permease subunit
VLNGYDEARRLQLYQAIETRLADESRNPQSGIRHATLANVAPVSGYYWTSAFVIEGREREQDLIPRGMAVSTNYFQVMGIALRKGRLLETRDHANAPRAAVISESLARRAFPEGNVVGQRFLADPREPRKTTFEIVGVVADADLYDPRNRTLRDAVYVPYLQWAFSPQAMVIQARATRPEAIAAAAETLRRVVRDLDPNLALYDIRTTEASLDNMLRTERMVALLSSAFALLAALLAAIGLHGLLAREVATRTRETGIRLALGASRSAVLWALTARTLAAVAVGILAGVAALLALQSVLRPLLVDLSPTNGTPLIAALFFLAVAAALGAWWPARRAAQVEPATALRND